MWLRALSAESGHPRERAAARYVERRLGEQPIEPDMLQDRTGGPVTARRCQSTGTARRFPPR